MATSLTLILPDRGVKATSPPFVTTKVEMNSVGRLIPPKPPTPITQFVMEVEILDSATPEDSLDRGVRAPHRHHFVGAREDRLHDNPRGRIDLERIQNMCKCPSGPLRWVAISNVIRSRQNEDRGRFRRRDLARHGQQFLRGVSRVAVVRNLMLSEQSRPVTAFGDAVAQKYDGPRANAISPAAKILPASDSSKRGAEPGHAPILARLSHFMR
jgi:hypothetical protein